MNKLSKITIILMLITITLSTIFLSSKKKTDINSYEYKHSDASMISMMIQDKTGVYIESKDQPWPGNNYVFNAKLSKCKNGSRLKYNELENKINVETAKTDMCYAYFDNKYFVKDLSGNNYYGTLMNGAIIKDDGEGNIGLFFDGEDDYVDIVDLPASIDWESGFTIEFEAKWLAFNYWSRIFDFGNGADSNNIIVSNFESTSDLAILVLDNRAQHRLRGGTLVKNKREKIKIIVTKINSGYQVDSYLNDNKIVMSYDSVTNAFKLNSIKNIVRTNNYLGKSNWSSIDDSFNGYIYNLKITDAKGNTIIWYKFD